MNNKFPNIPQGYDIDHIVPMSWFGDSWEQMRCANDVRNLRLLPHIENIKRSNRLTIQDLNIYSIWDIYNEAENPKGYKLIEECYKLAS